jgi:hypothetical protein
VLTVAAWAGQSIEDLVDDAIGLGFALLLLVVFDVEKEFIDRRFFFPPEVVE